MTRFMRLPNKLALSPIFFGALLFMVCAASANIVASEPLQQPAVPEIWRLLRAGNTYGYFHGLPQRLEAAIRHPKHSSVWSNADPGGALQLTIEVDPPINHQKIFIGFFTDARWWVEPVVQVRSFPGPGEYTVENLIPGKYVLGVMVGSMPEVESLGLHSSWPEFIEIKSEATTSAKVLASKRFHWSKNADDFETYLKEAAAAADNAVSIQIRDDRNLPVPFATVQVQDNSRAGRKIFGANERGIAICDSLEGRFTFSVTTIDFVPKSLLTRIDEYRWPNEILNLQQNARIKKELIRPPRAYGRLSGRVKDHLFRPIEGYSLTLRTESDSVRTIYRLPCIKENGAYDLSLPIGDYTAYCFPFESGAYEWPPSATSRKVQIREQSTTTAHFLLRRRNHFYGRVVYSDGTPVKNATWTSFSSGSIAADGSFLAIFTDDELQQVRRYFDAKMTIHVHGPSPHPMPRSIDALSRDVNHPLKIVLPK